MDRGRVLYSHWHYYPFIQSPWRVHCSETYIVSVHSCLEKTIGHVQGRENFSLSKVRQYLMDEGDWGLLVTVLLFSCL